MKMLLIGYGKMGRAIEKIALGLGHEVTGTADTFSELQRVKSKADVAIEFTEPEAVIKNLEYCFNAQLPVVCGTTGWHEKRKEAEARCLELNGGFFYSSNFSLGVNLFFHLNKALAKLMKNKGYIVSMEETHHTQKKDAPSGTAITIAEGIMENYEPKIPRWTLNEASSDELPIRSYRVDPMPGTHLVRYDSSIDSIEIKHTAHSREGFAKGAVLAAEWMAGKHGIFGMDDFLKDMV